MMNQQHSSPSEFNYSMGRSQDEKKATLSPVITGQSVLAIRYRDGVMLSTDTQLCYGKYKKYSNISRLFPLHQSNVLLGFSGEYSDTQYVLKQLRDLETRDFVSETRVMPKNAKEITGWLSRMYYGYRNEFDPLLNEVAVAGFDGDEPYLGYVNYHGTAYSDLYVATGFGAYFAVPLLRERGNVNMSEEDARALLKECMIIVYSRDSQAHNRIQIGRVTKSGVFIDEPVDVHPNWNFESFTRPTNITSFVGCSW